jgi:hypothetical protein
MEQGTGFEPATARLQGYVVFTLLDTDDNRAGTGATFDQCLCVKGTALPFLAPDIM